MRHPIAARCGFLLAGLLAAAPVAAAPVTLFDFDDGTLQGWTRQTPFGGNLFADPTGGNPGGFMVASDTRGAGGSLLALAPASISGDLSGFDGLLWDEFVYDNGSFTRVGTGVVLRGAGGTEYRSEQPLGPRGVFNPRFAAFDDASMWTLRTGTASFADVVKDVSVLLLTLDTSTQSFGRRESGVDNVCLATSADACATAPRVPEPGALALAGLGLLGVASLRRRRHRRTEPGL